jgi:antibiotic biosynthesis monooxygenase (ABM) superfamily enzyme
MPIAAEFPGHLGANVIRPSEGQNLWTVIIRFDTIEHLYGWTQSDTRNALVKEIEPLAEGDKTGSAYRSGVLVYAAGDTRA